MVHRKNDYPSMGMANIDVLLFSILADNVGVIW